MSKFSEMFYSLKLRTDLALLKVDNFLIQRKKSEIYMIYLVPVLFIGYITLQVTVPSFTSSIQKAKVKLADVEKQVADYRAQLKSIKDGILILKILESKNDELKDEIAKITKENYEVEAKIDFELKEIKHNSISWSKYLLDITKAATTRGVKLDQFANAINPELKYGVFEKIIDIDINATGSYTKVMDFLDTLERDERLVEITNLTMGVDKNIVFKSHLDVWGTK